MESYPTHLIYQALGKPHVLSEPCTGICAFCGTEIQEGVRLEKTVSEAFTMKKNYPELYNQRLNKI